MHKPAQQIGHRAGVGENLLVAAVVLGHGAWAIGWNTAEDTPYLLIAQYWIEQAQLGKRPEKAAPSLHQPALRQVFEQARQRRLRETGKAGGHRPSPSDAEKVIYLFPSQG
jgi:hypothetical protein